MSVLAGLAKANDAEIRRLTSLYRLLSALSRARVLDDVYEAALTSLLEATDADRAAILLFGEDGVLRFKASHGLSDEYQAAVTGHSPWPQGALDPQPIVVADVQNDVSLAPFREILAREGIRALTFVPLALTAGVFGKFMLYYATIHDCTPDEMAIAQAIGAHVALAVERGHLEIAGGHLASIVENSDDAIIGKNLDGIVTSWNKGAERTFGYTENEVIGRPISILRAEDQSPDEMPGILARIRKGIRVDRYETRRRRKDGVIINVALTVSPIRDGAGRIVGASKIARDITAQKNAEQERAMLHARERDARRIAEMLNSVAPRLVAQLNPERLTQEITDIATDLIQADFGAFFHNVGTERGESHMHFAVSGAPREAFAEFATPGSTDLFGTIFRGEDVLCCDDVTQDLRYAENPLRFAMPKGPLGVRSFLAAPVVLGSGEVLGGLFFGHSVAGRFGESHVIIIKGIAAQAAIAMDNARLFDQSQWVQTELKRSNEDLRRANRDLQVFAYSASHDLQEPLRTISISAQLIERNLGSRLSGDEAMFLSNILKGTRSMTGLIQDILEYTKATKYEEGFAPAVDARRVLEAVLDSLSGPIAEARAKITTGELPSVAIHEGRLAQLFQNLISNAIKYCKAEVPSVHINAEDRDGFCVFSVVDNGIGVEPQFAEQIFGLFKRLHGRDVYPGSGIGLAICQRIVEQYGGRIWLEHSAPGQGSTFCFTLPSRT